MPTTLGEAKSDGSRGALVLKREGAAIYLSVSKTKQTGGRLKAGLSLADQRPIISCA